MDVSFNNVLEGTRQYFLGVPKAQEGSGQSMWPSGTPPEEGTPAMSGAPAPSSRPPSAAAAPPSTPTPTPVVPPRPPSEPIEPEPHIIHKATVMREAAEKRREQPELEDEEEPVGAISPPSHIIRKPTPHTLPSPAPAPAAPCPSPARPPSSLPIQQCQQPEKIESPQYRTPLHQVQTPTPRPVEDFSSGRPPDPYPQSRPPETYPRYQYESSAPDSSRNSHGPPVASPLPSAVPRQSPQTYARLSGSMTQHSVHRLNEANTSSPPTQRYSMPPQAPPPHNDRVPPIYHPQTLPPTKRITSSANVYGSLPHRREQSTSISRSHFERHPSLPQRKYDHQHTYSGYRPASTSLQHNMTNHRMDQHHQAIPYKHNVSESLNSHYTSRSDRTSAPIQPHPQDALRIQTRMDYISKNGSADARNSYHYPTPSTSSSRYHPSPTVPVVHHNSATSVRSSYRQAVAPKSNYSYPSSSHTNIQTSPSRSSIKSGYQNQQTRMTVSVTSLVNEMNQTKQKRESPLDLSVKTVKNSADSSTTQDDSIDSASLENKSLPIQPRPQLSNSRHALTDRYVSSHKVDFAPDFAQYRDRVRYATASQHCTPPQRYSVPYESSRPMVESYSVESRQHVYAERVKCNRSSLSRNEYVPRIDLTRNVIDERLVDNRRREEGRIEERKRTAGPVVSNIPEKIMRREAWSADARERLSQSAREQRDLMSRPVYDYTSHKKLEAYQYEMKQPAHNYHDSRISVNQPYSRGLYAIESSSKEAADYHNHYHERYANRQIIQKASHRETPHHHLNMSNGVPQAEKSKVLSILRNSLETRQSATLENAKPSIIPDLIVIDDVDDSVIEITDLTKENEKEVLGNNNYRVCGSKEPPSLGNHIQMPKAVDSLPCDTDFQRVDSVDSKSKSPENDVASRIRTKAELKVMPPSQDSVKMESRPKTTLINNDTEKSLPKSQKQHLFNQIRQDNLRFESVVLNDKCKEVVIPEVKSEPMNIEEIEKDAMLSIKTENFIEEDIIKESKVAIDSLDMDWASACDSFMEQLQTGNHKNKSNRNTIDPENDFNNKNDTETKDANNTNKPKESVNIVENLMNEVTPITNIKQEPLEEEEEEESKPLDELSQELQETAKAKEDKIIQPKKIEKPLSDKIVKKKSLNKNKCKRKGELITTSTPIKPIKKEKEKNIPIKTIIKQETESTDDDEPLIKSKILKDKEKSEQLKYQLLKDLSEKSAIVKLECCNASTRISTESTPKENYDKQNKPKQTRSNTRSKSKLSTEIIKSEPNNDESSTESEEDTLTLSSRLRTRKKTKSDDKTIPAIKTSVKSSPSKKLDNSSASNRSTPVRKSGFGDGSDFHPGWEEELYRYKRSLRMPTRLIAIPRGRSGGPFVKGSNSQFPRGSTSLPDLDPVPLSPAPSSAPSVVTDELYRRPEKTNLDSDLESNSSYSTPNRLQYDSEASTSTVISTTKPRKNRSSIVDELIKKCGSRDSSKKKCKDKEEKNPKMVTKLSNMTELLPTPSLGLIKNGHKGNLGGKREKILEDIFYLGAFRKETVTAFRDAFIKDTNGLIGATEEFAPLMLKSRTRTESRVLKQRATIKEVFGDDRPASAPPTSCREEEAEDMVIEIKKEPECKTKMKPKISKDKLKKRSNSIRDGLRSTVVKRNDAKGRMMRLKKRNSLLKNIPGKRIKEICSKPKKEKSPLLEEKSAIKEEGSSVITSEGTTKKRFKRLFGRRKLSSGFDYIRKKKKPIRKEENVNKVRRLAPKPSPESVHDIQKEIKGWFINKSIGETHLHRAARLGFTDCVAYCLEKMESNPSAKDNAGFTPLHVAAARGHVRIARLLLQYGANVSAAAQGGIRPLHEACESSHVEIIRLLLSYGADPLLGTYAGQTPEELAEGTAAKLLRLYIADVQGQSVDPWRFPPPNEIIDREEIGCEPLSSPPPASPPPTPDSTIEIQCTDTPLPPFYSLRTATGQPADGLWCLLQDVTNILQIKSKESLLKQIHCGSGSPKELLREIRTQEFLERAQCHQLLCAGEKVNVRASKVALIRVTDKLRQLLKIETILVS